MDEYDIKEKNGELISTSGEASEKKREVFRSALKNDLKKVAYFSKIFLTISFFFVIFCLIFILPIYGFSKNYTALYTAIVLILIGAGLSFSLIARVVRVAKKYNNFKPFFVHIFMFYLAPVLIFSFILFTETFFFRLFYQILPFLPATLALISINFVVFIAMFFVRKLYFHTKHYLESRSVKY